ncbi:unnamed protein product, partial [Oppiella nova]
IYNISQYLLKTGESLTYDPSFKGPIKSRSCTDILCLLVFIAFITGWIIIAILGFISGNPEKLIYPTDTYGNICGRGDYRDKPYLFFFNLLKCAKNINENIFDRCDTPQVCVSQCPDQTFSLYHLTQLDANYKNSIICRYNVIPTNDNFQQLIKDDKCAGIYFKSEPFGGRCIPSLLSMNGKNVIDEKNKGVTLSDDENTAIDLERIKKTNQGLALAMIVSFAWIVCMQWFAQIMIWFSLLAVVVLNAYGLYYSLNRYKDLGESDDNRNDTLNANQYNFRKSMDTGLDSYLTNRKTWFAFSIICALILFVMILVLLYLRKRIKLAIALIEEASRAVSCVKSSLFFPIIPYILQLIVICFWGSVAIMIAASARANYRDPQTGQECTPNSDPNLSSNTITKKCIFIKYYEDNVIMAAQAYNLFGLLWGLFFVIGIGQVSLAGAFASYYWVFKKPKEVPFFAVFGGFYRCLRYHIGSVALGSLLIATVRFIRIIIEYIDKKCKKYANNCIAKAIVCCRCFFWLLESFMKFINKNAYIMIAIYGKGFCSSASNGFSLILRNATRAVVLDKVTDLLLIIGKLTVTSIVAVLSFYVFTQKFEFISIPSLHYNWVPIVVITIGTYLIASSFFSVYHMAVDTLFLCFLEDCERNDGSQEKPYYMSRNLMRVLSKKNKT